MLFAPGVRVLLHGLLTEEINNSSGTIGVWVDSRQRYLVAIDKGLYHIRAENVKAMQCPSVRAAICEAAVKRQRVGHEASLNAELKLCGWCSERPSARGNDKLGAEALHGNLCANKNTNKNNRENKHNRNM